MCTDGWSSCANRTLNDAGCSQGRIFGNLVLIPGLSLKDGFSRVWGKNFVRLKFLAELRSRSKDNAASSPGPGSPLSPKSLTMAQLTQDSSQVVQWISREEWEYEEIWTRPSGFQWIPDHQKHHHGHLLGPNLHHYLQLGLQQPSFGFCCCCCCLD